MCNEAYFRGFKEPTKEEKINVLNRQEKILLEKLEKVKQAREVLRAEESNFLPKANNAIQIPALQT